MKAALLALAMMLVLASTESAADGVDLYGDPLPVGAMARLGTVRYRHPGWHKRVAFLPDNQTLVVGTSDNTVRSWNARTGKLIHELDLGGDSLRSFCLSADGRRVATLSWRRNPESRETHQRLSIWHAVSWRELKQFTWSEQLGGQSVEHIAFSADKQLIAGGAMDGTVRMWDSETGEMKTNRNVVRGDVLALAFSPRQELIAVAGMDGVMMWEYLTENPPEALPAPRDRAQALCFSHDGTLLAVGADGARAAQVYDVRSRRPLPQLKGESDGYYPEGLCFSPDDQRIVLPADRTGSVEIYDVDAGKLVKKLAAGRIKPRDVATSPDGKLVAAVGSESAILVWDTATGARLGNEFVGHLESPYEVAFTADGRRVVTACLDGTIRIWDAATGRQERVLEHERWVAGLAISPDGRRIVSCGLDDTVRLWDADSGDEIFKLPGHGNTGGSGTTEVAFSPDGERFYSFGGDMYLRTYGMGTGRALEEHALRPAGFDGNEDEDGLRRAGGDPFAGLGRGGFSLEQARFSADRTRLLVGERMSGKVHIFDVATGKELDVYKPEGQLQDYAASPDGRYLTTIEEIGAPGPAPGGMRDFVSTLRLRDWATKEMVHEVMLPGRFVSDLAYSPSGNLIGFPVSIRSEETAAIANRWICVLDANTLEMRALIDDSGASLSHLAFSPNDEQLATACGDSTVTIWDLRQFQRLYAAP